MSWPAALDAVGTLLAAAFVLTAANDPKFFNFSRRMSNALDYVVFGSLVLAGLMIAAAALTTLLQLATR